MTNINLQLISFNIFKRAYRFNIFRHSINFKKYTKKKTKLKRKALIRVKHATNWFLYSSVLDSWVSDFIFCRQITNFQFLNKIFINNFYLYNFNLLKQPLVLPFASVDFVFNNLSKKVYKYFKFKNYLYFNNSNITFGWHLNALNFDKTLIPVCQEYSNSMYFFDETELESLLITDDINSEVLFDLLLQNAFEVYKIIYLNILLSVNCLKS